MDLGYTRKGSVIKFERQLNTYDFGTEEKAKNFEKIYIELASKVMEELKARIKKGGIVDPPPTIDEEVEQRVKFYFLGGLQGSRELGRDHVLEETRRLYDLSEDLEFLKKMGAL